MDARSFFEKTVGVSDIKAVDKLERVAEFKKFHAGELLCEEGMPAGHITFLLKGILRGFYVDENGHEITDCFVTHHGTAVMSNFGLEEANAVSIEAAVESEVLRIPAVDSMELLNESKECLQLYVRMVQQSFRRHWEIKGVITQYPALERYQWFLRTFPGLIGRVNNRHVASFLGMTPVTLSRIRRAIREESAERMTEGNLCLDR